MKYFVFASSDRYSHGEYFAIKLGTITRCTVALRGVEKCDFASNLGSLMIKMIITFLKIIL